MKAVFLGFLTLSLLALCNVSTTAQTNPPVSGSTLVGTFTATSYAGDQDPNMNSVDWESDVEYIIWLTPNDETVLAINVNSAEFASPCEWAETINLDDLMDDWAIDGLAEAESLGYISAAASCPPSAPIKVYYPTCVKRDNSGQCPQLLAEAGTSFSYNAYNVCIQSGTLSISLVSVTCGSGNCGTGYDSTCP